MTVDDTELLGQLQVEHREWLKEQAAETHRMMLGAERAVALKIHDLREERGWSQAELAAKLTELGFGMHQTTVAKLEAGKRPLRVAELYAFGAIFNLPPAAFLHLPLKGGSISMDYLRARLEDLDGHISRYEEDFHTLLVDKAKIYAEFVVERERAVLAMRQAAARGDDGEHPEAP